MRHGVHIGFDSILRQQLKSYVNNTLFLEYINDIFVPYLNELQKTKEFKVCEAVLLMKNCSSHISNDVLAILTRERVRVVTFVIYMTCICQILDVVLFGALKKHATGFEKLDEESRTAAFLLKVYCDFKQTMVEINIWGAFAAIGFTYDIDQTPYGLLFDEEKFGQSPGFVELWERNPSLDSLPKRQRKSKLGRIKKLESIDLI
jgi:hypothetical protein